MFTLLHMHTLEHFVTFCLLEGSLKVTLSTCDLPFSQICPPAILQDNLSHLERAHWANPQFAVETMEGALGYNHSPGSLNVLTWPKIKTSVCFPFEPICNNININKDIWWKPVCQKNQHKHSLVSRPDTVLLFRDQEKHLLTGVEPWVMTNFNHGHTCHTSAPRRTCCTLKQI